MRRGRLAGAAWFAATAWSAAPPQAAFAQSALEERVSVEAPQPPDAPLPVPRIGSIDLAIAAAYEHNPQLLAQRAQVRAGDARYAQARALYGPTISFSGTYGYALDSVDVRPGLTQRSSGWSGTASAVLSQPLYTSGRLRSGVLAAEADIAFRRQSLRLVESEVLLGVYSAYIGVRRDRELLRIVTENLDLLRLQLSQSEDRFGVREITIADLDQVRARVGLGSANLESARASLSVAGGRFLQFVGALPGEELAPLPAGAPSMPRSLEEAYAIAERESPLLLVAHARERISRAQVKQARAELGPTVSAQGSAARGAVQPYSNDLNQTQLRGGVTISWPLYTSGLNDARIRETEEINQADWRLIDQALRDLRAEVEANWDQHVAARASVEHLRAAVLAAARAYDGAVLQERAGARTTFEVLDLLRDLLTVRSQLVAAETSAELARYGLLAAMGRLEAPQLVDGVVPYAPGDNLQRVRTMTDAPPITPMVEALDSIGIGRNTGPRPYRDPAAGIVPPGLATPADPATPTAD